MVGANHLIANASVGTFLATGFFFCKATFEGAFNGTAGTPLSPILRGLSENKLLLPGTENELLRLVQPELSHPWLYITIWIALFIIGTLLPDIDSKTSLLGRVIHIPVEHRTWTHTIWICAILIAASFFVPFVWALTVGYILHIIIDSFSTGGICWFYPISQYRMLNNGGKIKKHHKGIYRVGKTSEAIFLLVLCAFFFGTSALMWAWM